MTTTTTLPAVEAVTQRDDLWAHCRNNLGIARLLLQEGGPAPLISTACHMAVETACRAALAHAGEPYDGDLERGLGGLGASSELARAPETATSAERLAWAEKAVAWVAAYLRNEAPGRPWGY